VQQDIGTALGEWNNPSYDVTLLKDAKTLSAGEET
jgi:hypothetical protein